MNEIPYEELTDWLVIYWLAGWLAVWLSDCLTVWLTVWLSGWWAGGRTDGRTDWRTDWKTEWKTECIHAWGIGQISLQRYSAIAWPTTHCTHHRMTHHMMHRNHHTVHQKDWASHSMLLTSALLITRQGGNLHSSIPCKPVFVFSFVVWDLPDRPRPSWNHSSVHSQCRYAHSTRMLNAHF